MEPDEIRERLLARRRKLESELEEITEALSGLEKAVRLASNPGYAFRRADLPVAEKPQITLRAALTELVKERGGTFTAPDLYEELRERWSELADVHKASVSGRVRQLAEDGLIVEVKPGAGSRAAVYALEASSETGENATAPSPQDGEADSGEAEDTDIQKGGTPWSN